MIECGKEEHIAGCCQILNVRQFQRRIAKRFTVREGFHLHIGGAVAAPQVAFGDKEEHVVDGGQLSWIENIGIITGQHLVYIIGCKRIVDTQEERAGLKAAQVKNRPAFQQDFPIFSIKVAQDTWLLGCSNNQATVQFISPYPLDLHLVAGVSDLQP